MYCSNYVQFSIAGGPFIWCFKLCEYVLEATVKKKKKTFSFSKKVTVALIQS